MSKYAKRIAGDVFETAKDARDATWYTLWFLVNETKGYDNLRPCLISDTGTGKTSRAKEMAHHLGLPMISLDLSGMLPEDIGGIPRPKPDQKESDHVKEVERWLLSTLAKAVREPCVIFLDELDKANEAVLGPALKLVHELIAGDYKLHPDTVVVAAMQPDTDLDAIMNSNTKIAIYNRIIPIGITSGNFVSIYKKFSHLRPIDDELIAMSHEMLGEPRIKSIDDIAIPKVPVNDRRVLHLLELMQSAYEKRYEYFDGDEEITKEVMANIWWALSAEPIAKCKIVASAYYEHYLAQDNKIEITPENIKKLINEETITVWDLAIPDLSYAIPSLFFNVEAKDGRKAFNDLCLAMKRAYTELPLDARNQLNQAIIEYNNLHSSELNGKTVFDGVSAQDMMAAMRRVTLSIFVDQYCKANKIEKTEAFIKKYEPLMIDESHADVYRYTADEINKAFVSFAKDFSIKANDVSLGETLEQALSAKMSGLAKNIDELLDPQSSVSKNAHRENSVSL